MRGPPGAASSVRGSPKGCVRARHLWLSPLAPKRLRAAVSRVYGLWFVVCGVWCMMCGGRFIVDGSRAWGSQFRTEGLGVCQGLLRGHWVRLARRIMVYG